MAGRFFTCLTLPYRTLLTDIYRPVIDVIDNIQIITDILRWPYAFNE
ncbi:hypothetical protein EC881467_3015 [Escherichia coli 88.1467]|nr:hypothetical protein EC93001_3095 [Escherichia coli 93-001]EIN41376.1 hypothetical protein ECFRIK1985_3152 [Escherichia coli FRIK1985]EIN42403.1 hypothetical protein ECFRIK1990_3067 [Escherichia coli FRIK1990]EKH47553.1 hypothetical protein ECNE037_3332 [Escherichia coli NE037]EKK79563.1 hypothetical protein EC80416_0267 [Escherichia coli 8.0416]EKV79757.1 hypothetical protein EC881467_3015 [Escherichia coli 88.1467]ELV36919.1 hypothetical protein EC990816_2570 [Escherichia coli 99.0816]E